MKESGNLLIVGWGRHGKDTAAMALHGWGDLVYAGSTSWQALPFMAKVLGVPEQIAWDERHNNRVRWWQECNKLRLQDPLFLVKRALQNANIVAGLRDDVEMKAAKASGLFKAILWVERPGVPEDPTVTFKKEDCTDFLLNDVGLNTFKARVRNWARTKGFLK